MNFLLIAICIILSISQLKAQWCFSSSLHSNRNGFTNSYNSENGGMERITNISINQLACLKCHSRNGLYANGSIINPESYYPTCIDCHDFRNGFTVLEEACLNCHEKQKRERELFPGMDVHQNAGMTCFSCHLENELHGDDSLSHYSLKEIGAIKVKCSDCHTQLSHNASHNRHIPAVDCSSCHAVSVYSCSGCHFETYVSSGKERFNNEFYNYRLLVKKDDKVHLGAIATQSYNGKSNYIISSTHSHTIKRNATSCSDCHNGMGQINIAIKEYNDLGTITITKWDSVTKKVNVLNAVIPIPSDWRQSLIVDHVTYLGDSSIFPTNPDLWTYLKSETDNAHLYFAEPLDSSTLEKLGFTRFTTDINNPPIQVEDFHLFQNYPNPFNSSTKIKWRSPSSGRCKIIIYDVLGNEITKLLDGLKPPGYNEILFDAGNLSSGVYFYRFFTSEKSFSRKMILLK